MKYQPFEFAPFTHSRLLFESRRDAYEANGHEYLAAAEAQHQIKMRSRQIAAGSTRILKERRPGASPVLEADVVRLIEGLANATLRGSHHPAPLSEELQENLIKLIASHADRAADWEILLMALLQAAERELDFENFVIFDHWHQHLLWAFRAARAAHAIRKEAPAAAARSCQRILQFCRPESGEWDEPTRAAITTLLEQFYTELARALEFGSPALLELYLARFASERLAVIWEASIADWMFIFSTLENELTGCLSSVDTRLLADAFVGLQRICGSLTFCGEIYRHAEELESALAPIATSMNVEPGLLLQVAVVGHLLRCFHTVSPHPPTLHWALVHGQSVLSRSEPEQLSQAARVLRDTAVRFCERHQVDHLEQELLSMAAMAQWRSLRRKEAQWIETLAQKVITNLSEALEAVRSSPRFSADLLALLDQACLSLLYFKSPRLSQSWLRQWFVLNMGISQAEHTWRNPRTIVRALHTLFQQHPADNPLTPFTAQALESLEPLEKWLQDVRQTREVWPHATAYALRLDDYLADPVCQRDGLWLLRRAVLSSALYEETQAIQAVHRYVAREIIPYAGRHRFVAYLETYGAVLQAVKNHPDLATSAAGSVFSRAVENCSPAILGARLWTESLTIGQTAAAEIYTELEDYRTRSGPDSQSLCARDNSLILRRVALATLASEDAFEFISQWWNNVVNLYLATRTPRLFHVQLRALTHQSDEHLGPPAGNLLRQMLGPVLLGTTGPDETVPPRLRFRPARAQWTSAPVAPTSLQEEIASWLPSLIGPSTGKNSPEGIPSSVLASALQAVQSSFSHWLLYNVPEPGAFCRVAQFSQTHPALLPHLETILHQALSECAAGSHAGHLIAPAFLCHWINWILRCRAATWLAEHTHPWAETVVQHAHQSFPSLTAQGVSAADPSKCQRDFTLLLQHVSHALQAPTLTEAVIETQRYVLQMIEPYAAYSGRLWGMFWQALRLHLPGQHDPSVRRVMEDFLSRLAFTARSIDQIAPICHRLHSGDQPVFSPDEAEEMRWRDTITLILVGSLFPEKDSTRTLTLAAMLPVPPVEATEKIPAILVAFGEWFLDLDLTRLRREVEALLPLLKAGERVEQISQGLTSAAERMSTLGPLGTPANLTPALHLLARRAAGLDLDLPQAFPVPWTLRAASLLCEHATHWVQSASKVRTACANLIGMKLESSARLDQSLDQFLATFSSLSALQSLWRQPESPSAGANSELPSAWLVRKLILSAPLPESADLSTLMEEPYSLLQICAQDQALIPGSLIQHLEESLRHHQETIPALQFILEKLRADSPRLLAAALLINQRQRLARESVQDVLNQSPDGINPDTCVRDTSLTLLALIEYLQHPDWALPLHHWWQDYVRPFLRTETVTITSRIHQSVLQRMEHETTPASAETIRQQLQPLLALQV